ncbi:GPP34 family phosphoprotein [Corynebacterium sp. LaCa142]|uniref:GPP34 family phosphoprotein n=1 Tax=Corynebacterium sp. LaCa142 TaxID=3391425 RepID=UPI003988A499
MLICQEMFLLLTKDNGKKEAVTNNETALSAGLFSDLLMHDAVGISAKNKVHATDKKPEHPVLAWAWDGLHERRTSSVKTLLQARWFSPREKIAQDFRDHGQLEIEDAAWWQLGGDRYIMTDTALEDEVRERLAAVLDGTQNPSVKDMIILDILREVKGAYPLLKEDAPEMKRREMRNRIKELKQQVDYDDAAASAVKTILQETTAIIAAAAASTAATT